MVTVTNDRNETVGCENPGRDGGLGRECHITVWPMARKQSPPLEHRVKGEPSVVRTQPSEQRPNQDAPCVCGRSPGRRAKVGNAKAAFGAGTRPAPKR